MVSAPKILWRAPKNSKPCSFPHKMCFKISWLFYNFIQKFSLIKFNYEIITKRFRQFFRVIEPIHRNLISRVDVAIKNIFRMIIFDYEYDAFVRLCHKLMKLTKSWAKSIKWILMNISLCFRKFSSFSIFADVSVIFPRYHSEILNDWFRFH